jgi:hypothetical protein
VPRVRRLIEYVGPREWLDQQLAGSINGTKRVGPNKTITVRTLTETAAKRIRRKQCPT